MDARTVLEAIKFLQGEGHSVEADEVIPGLYFVDGRELTSGQVVSYATSLATK